MYYKNNVQTVYSELKSYYSNLYQNQTTINSLKELTINIPTKIVLGDQTISQNICNENEECKIKNQHNDNYLKLIKNYCTSDNCELKIAENSGYYVPLDRLDIIISMIYNFLK